MRTLPLRFAVLCLIFLFAASAFAAQHSSKVELKDGAYYIDGHKFFVNALGYEPGARPGEHPYQKRVVNLELLRQDLKNIKAAGFNTIRTWSDLTEDELKVVQASGLKLIFGVKIVPDENWNEPKIFDADLAWMSRTLAYSKKYDCIITYLIMNEPMPAHIHKVGAEPTRALWTKLRDMIHAEHPGVPVTISGNTAITGWVDMNLFDVYGHNTYDYDHEGANYTHRYVNANKFVEEINGAHKPVLVTEFGRSVSRQGFGVYGGNTLDEQARAVLADYRGLLDSGVAGVVPFYYADGWWKGGEPNLHNDTPEEWFGFWGYNKLDDTAGHPRPVWYALEQYNKALVSQPRNHEFYQNEVPVEVFCLPEVRKIRVVYLDGVLLEGSPDAHGYYSGKLSFAGENLKDRELVIESLDARGRVVKVETIIVLTGKDAIVWPTLTVKTGANDLDGTRELPMEFTLTNNGPLELTSDLRYAVAPHKGWEGGPTFKGTLDGKLKTQMVKDTYKVNDETIVLGIYGGADFRYGKFTKTIYTQKYLFRGTWADALRLK